MSQDAVNKRLLAATRRKLERAELEHLRRHAAELAEQLEKAERRIQIAEDRAYNAESMGQMWHETAMELQQAEIERNPAARINRIGITKDGQLLRVPA